MTEGSLTAIEIVNRHLEYMDGLKRGQRWMSVEHAVAAVEEALSRTAPDGGRAMALEEAAQSVRAIKRPSVDFYGAVARHLDLAEETIRALADGEKGT